MTATPATDPPRLRLGISACLLGQDVRYDGTNKRERFCTDVLGPHVEWVPVCPEVELGLGIPRPAIRLEREGDRVRLRDPKNDRDHTAAMDRYARQRVRALAKEDLDGYVSKARSPSCGVFRVKLHQPGGGATNDGQGRFAAALTTALPDLPIEEEGRLNDPRLRETFIERIFAYRRLKERFRGRWRSTDLVAFHTAHKLQLLSHDPSGYRTLGRLVATAGRAARATLRAEYTAGFLAAMARPASRGRHANVLQHMAGYFRPKRGNASRPALDDASRAELAECIDAYRRELVPLVVPVTLLRHHARRLREDYLLGQTYLEPHPRELMLRNHV